MDIDTQLNLFSDQRAKGENWTFGIEVETTLPESQVQNMDIGDYHNGEPVYGAPRFNDARWLAEHDSSIRTNSYSREGVEFVSPILVGNEGVTHMLEFTKWLQSIGARVNHSCGLHIHIGIDSVLGRGASTAKMVTFLTKVAHLSYRWQDALYAQTGTRRDRNHYCERIRDDSRWVMEVQQEQRKPVAEKCRHDTRLNSLQRYAPVNLQNMNGKGTIEFRAFAGTLNKYKLMHHLWSVFAIIHNAKRSMNTTNYRWQQKSPGQGSESLKWFYHHLGKNFFLPSFRDNYRRMRVKAEDLAVQYDNRG